jgi:hypothetical protein
VLGDVGHRQVEEVDHVHVEVDQEPVGGAHPGQRLGGRLPGAAADPLGRDPGQAAAGHHLLLFGSSGRWATAMESRMPVGLVAGVNRSTPPSM